MLSTWLNTTSTSSDFRSTLNASSTSNSASTDTVQTASDNAQAKTEDDSVKLSQAAQERMLYKQGESVSTIASTLGTTSKTVNEDLGIALEKEIEQTLQATETAQ